MSENILGGSVMKEEVECFRMGYLSLLSLMQNAKEVTATV
jgi:hypothetical protein